MFGSNEHCDTVMEITQSVVAVCVITAQRSKHLQAGAALKLRS